MSLCMKVLKAQNGDCILIQYGTDLENTILIDGEIGKKCRYQLRSFMMECMREKKRIELLILTHIDSDHISGILSLFSWKEFDSSIIEEIWFNCDENIMCQESVVAQSIKDGSTKISWKQADELQLLLKDKEIRRKNRILRGMCYQSAKLKITVLSPDDRRLKEYYLRREDEMDKGTKIAGWNDYAMAVEALNNAVFHGKVTWSNQGSIAVLLEYEGINMLLLGDVPSDAIIQSLVDMGYSKESPLEVLCCKVAHHASKHNTSGELIRMIRCHNYIISSNMTASGRPSKECLSRILCNSAAPVCFYCNYDIDWRMIFTTEEFAKYQMKFVIIDESGIDLEEMRDERECI